MKKFYVTTPIYYVNAPPHMGTGYTTVIADALARTKRMQGFDARLVTGSDEHSQNIADKAAAAGMTPDDFCKQFIPEFHKAWKLLDIGPYEFYRTSSPEHRVVVQAFFKRIHERGDIYKKDYSGWYHTTDNRFLNEDEVPAEPESHPFLKYLTEEAYWFRLSRYQDWLLDHHEKNPQAIVPDFRRNEMLNRIKEGLRDLCISRSSTDWGIPLPWDDKHVFYVWVDALLTYLTGSGFQLEAENQSENSFWPCDLHCMAKDIPWFHTVIWPAMLASAQVAPARQCLVHGYWNFGDGTKMSKSKGNVFSPEDAVALVGSDGVRYFLLREVRLGYDGTFSVKGLAERYNFDLANDFGNLLHRALSMCGRYLEGRIPTKLPANSELEELRKQVADQVPAQYDCLEFKEALEKTWELVRACNRYIDDTKPFEVAKHPERREELEAIFAQLFSSIRTLLLLLAPLLPRGCDDYWTQLGLPGKATEARLEDVHQPFPEGIVAERKPRIVYQKLDLGNIEDEFINRKETMTGQKVERVETETKTPEPKKEARPEAAGDDYITYEDFNKVRLITAKVVKAEAVEGADKLIRLTVDDGKRSDRTVVSGIRQHFTPEDMQGRTICIVDNLKPRKIFGIMSEGMILAAGDGTSLHLVTPQGELAPGVRVG